MPLGVSDVYARAALRRSLASDRLGGVWRQTISKGHRGGLVASLSHRRCCVACALEPPGRSLSPWARRWARCQRGARAGSCPGSQAGVLPARAPPARPFTTRWSAPLGLRGSRGRGLQPSKCSCGLKTSNSDARECSVNLLKLPL